MKIALIGNQNSGKSTLFNTLTGSNQKIGNWPGVTIEKKTGVIKNTNFELIDLPGTYSLKPYTKEEKVTSDFVLNEKVDVLLNIIDCNSISRGLYLTTQLIDIMQDERCETRGKTRDDTSLDTSCIVLLNMYDIAAQKGIQIDEKKLSEMLGNIPVIKVSALTGEGMERLVTELKDAYMKTKNNSLKANQLKSNQSRTVKSKTKNNQSLGIYALHESEIEQRYHFIDSIIKEAITTSKTKKETLTDKIDKLVLNRFLAIPIFIVIISLIYIISIEIIGNHTVNIIQSCFELASKHIVTWLTEANTSPALISLLTNGIMNGISAVTSFLPQLAFLFMVISCLEKIGYMSRISLIFDKLFKKLGISGNSVISFILGTGCSVPGIMATRVIKDEQEKKITTVLTPFIPCSAKLPIISLFSTYFFREKSGLVAVSFYILSIFIIILSSFIFQKANKIKRENSYISELPEFRIPKLTQILRDSIDRVLDFLKRAGSIILVSSICVWIMLSYSKKLEYGVNIQNSILADIGRTFSWLFVPMVGENSWEIAVSSIQGLIAKEQVISSMAIIAGLENQNISNSIFVNGSPFEFFSPISAYAYVCFNLFCAPCFGAISAMKKTLGGIKNTLKAVSYQIGIAYILSCLIYLIGNKI